MRTELESQGYRVAFVEENVKTGIAFQIRALREHNKWTQKELGTKTGKPQNVVSRLEDPDYGKITLRTLLDVAAAFDVALLVKFVSFGELLSQLRNLSPEALAVPSFEEERDVPAHIQSQIEALAAPSFNNGAQMTDLQTQFVRNRSGAKAALEPGYDHESRNANRSRYPLSKQEYENRIN